MPTALLAGAFGQRNPGDEALLRGFLAALPPGWEGVATSATPLATRTAHACEAVSARDPRAVARAVIAADAVVFAGGTVFKRLPPSTGRRAHDLLLKATAVALAASATGTPLAMVGVGAAPLETPAARALARALISRADLLVLRDEESADLLAAAAGRATTFRVGADAAWTLMAGALAPSSRGEQVTVAVSLPAGGRALIEYLSAALAVVVRAGRPVALQPWQVMSDGLDDVVIAQAVAGRLAGAATVLDPPRDLTAARDVLAGSAVVLGMRFHSLIAAAAAGVPFMAFAHEPKLAGLARRLGQPAAPPGTPPERLAEQLLAAAAAPPAAAAAIEREIGAAEDGMRLLRLLLSPGLETEMEATEGLALRPLEWIP